ncbi:hypothetical protein KFL_001590070 [Klebsormidium nitens]|uniref:Uncharacterized protein n=1 Tax=Klebsormidium nitens TaxID=105231 RepID=A0A1Y1I2T1_KLENI|nr:hypothetical protein KFL_001590070 [Klebsormidium nitens]|eukprot:GAQ83719.1 hypothetical protein KFL_001590070 [Klebsormidium nitens]
MDDGGVSSSLSRQQEILARLRLATEKRAAGIQATRADTHAEDHFPRPALQHRGASRQRGLDLEEDIGKREAAFDLSGAFDASWGDVLEPESAGQSADASRRVSIAQYSDTGEEKRLTVSGTLRFGPFDNQEKSGGDELGNVNGLEAHEERSSFSKQGHAKAESGGKDWGVDLRASRKSDLAKLLQSRRQSVDGTTADGVCQADATTANDFCDQKAVSLHARATSYRFKIDRRASAFELPEDDDTAINEHLEEAPRNDEPVSVSGAVLGNGTLMEQSLERKSPSVSRAAFGTGAGLSMGDSETREGRIYNVTGTGLWQIPMGPESSFRQQKAAARESFSKVLSEFERIGDDFAQIGDGFAQDLPQTSPSAAKEAEQAFQDAENFLSRGGNASSPLFARTSVESNLASRTMFGGGVGRGELLTPQSSATPTTFGRLSESYSRRAPASRFGYSPGTSSRGDAVIDDVSRGDDVADDVSGGAPSTSGTPGPDWRSHGEIERNGRLSDASLASPDFGKGAQSSSSRSVRSGGSEGVYDPEVFYAADVLGDVDAGNAPKEDIEDRVASLERAILRELEEDDASASQGHRRRETGNASDVDDEKDRLTSSLYHNGRTSGPEGNGESVEARVRPLSDTVRDSKEKGTGADGRNETGDGIGANERGRADGEERKQKSSTGASGRPGTARSTGKENGVPKGKVTKVEPFRLSSGTGERHRKETVRRRVQEEMQKKLTFKPHILQSSSIPGGTFRLHGEDRIRQLARPRSSTYEKYAQDRIRQLARPRSSTYEKYAQVREQRENETMQSCSFRPSVSIDSGMLHQRKGPIDERLHGEWRRKATERERIRRAVEQAELEKCTFRPHISDVSELLASEDRRPIYERFEEIQRRKSEALARAREQLQRNEGTFRPKINHRSERIALRMGLEEIDVADRLTTFASTASLGRKLRCVEERELEEQEKCPFRPEINPSTERILNEALYVPADGDFLTRQHLFNELRYQKQLELQSRQSAECRFRPDIGSAEEVLAQAGRNAGESRQELIERLACTDKERLEAIRRLKAEQHYAQFEFRPALNPISRLVGRPPSVELLHKDDRAKQKLEMLRAEAEEAQKRECTFQPELSRPSLETSDSRRTISMRDPELISARIQEQERERLARIEAVRELQREQELQDCTFRPAINGTPPEQLDQPVIVPGLGRYLELQEMSKRLKKEQEERERRAFLLEIPSNLSRQSTKPQPFRLHSGSEQRKAEVARRAEEDFEEKCTFRPETNAGKTKKFVKQVLRE